MPHTRPKHEPEVADSRSGSIAAHIPIEGAAKSASEKWVIKVSCLTRAASDPNRMLTEFVYEPFEL